MSAPSSTPPPPVRARTAPAAAAVARERRADSCTDDPALWRAASAGAWLGFDGIASATFDRHLALVVEARRRQLLARLLLSHDGNAFPAGGRLPRDFHLLLTSFRYRLADEGLSDEEIARLLVANPSKAWGGGVRRHQA